MKGTIRRLLGRALIAAVAVPSVLVHAGVDDLLLAVGLHDSFPALR